MIYFSYRCPKWWAKQKDVLSTLPDYEDPKAPRWLAEKTNIPALKLPNSVGGNDTATDLFSLFDSIINRLLSAP